MTTDSSAFCWTKEDEGRGVTYQGHALLFYHLSGELSEDLAELEDQFLSFLNLVDVALEVHQNLSCFRFILLLFSLILPNFLQQLLIQLLHSKRFLLLLHLLPFILELLLRHLLSQRSYFDVSVDAHHPL